MKEVIGVVFIVGWLGFWVWLWLVRPEAFRRAHNALQGAFDKAAEAGADALHREVRTRKKPQPPAKEEQQ